MTEKPTFLLDVNVLVALFSRNHIHHLVAKEWFYSSPDLQWGLCAFSEAGFVRVVTAPRPGQISMNQAVIILSQLAKNPGYRYVPIVDDWQTLTSPFTQRLFGTKQVTAAYLLGLSIKNGLVLATMDKAILHLAGQEYERHVVLIESK